jgi:Tol biopolymer transport system component
MWYLLRAMASSRLAILGAAVALPLLAAAHGASGASPTPSIVFAAHPDGSGTPQLFRVQTTGEGLQQFTTGRLQATAPAFSPDGTRIVFGRLGSGIFRVNLDGTGLRRLTSGGRDSYPVWSPDGRRIAFVRLYRAQWRVNVMSASGGGQHRLPQAPPAGRPTWTADGKGMFVPSGGDLIRIDSRTGKVLEYYGLAFDVQTAQTATVSPDGRRVAYVGPRASTGPPDCGEGPCPQYGLYLANVRRPHRARRTFNDTGPAGWSPDGKTLVFVSRTALTTWPVAGGASTPIASAPHVATGDAPPAWQPR